MSDEPDALEELYQGIAESVSVMIRTLAPIATSGAFGAARTCTILAEKGFLTQTDIINISFDALHPFDLAMAGKEPLLPPIAKTLERLRQSLEAEWDKAIRAAYLQDRKRRT